MSDLRALSVMQPWAWLILRPDLACEAARAEARALGRIKDIENRTWSSDTRGWVLLHASATRLAKWDWQAAALFAAKRGVDIPLQTSAPLGAYVGAIRIDGCEKWSRSPWFSGEGFGFRIGDSVPFAEPVPGPGTLQFFPVPPPGAGLGGALLRGSVLAALRAARLAEAFRL